MRKKGSMGYQDKENVSAFQYFFSFFKFSVK